MNGNKSIFQSRTFYGLVVAILAAATNSFLGYNIEMAIEGSMTDLIAMGVEFGAMAYALYGRIKATKKIA